MTEFAPWIAIGLNALLIVGGWIRMAIVGAAQDAKIETQIDALKASDLRNVDEIRAVELRSTTAIAALLATLTATLQRIEDRVNRIAEHPQ
jgi:hypothetical protein